jgi:tRNA pseudouridine55 synthase
MGRRRARGRPVDGILLLDKPLGITSNDALQQVKRLYFAQKAGHTGSLDPLADGLLPICLGNATKLSAFLLDADKHYWVRVRLGEKTTTQDAEGEVIETRPADHITQADIEAVIPRFLGEIDQLPPMYSAVKHEGQRLYKLAREGKQVERTPRRITIHSLQLTKFEAPEFEMLVHCSKGTYVRTLAEDMGEALGCGAHVVGLRRTGVGPYTSEGMVTLDRLKALYEEDKFQLDKLLIPIDSALADWPAVQLNEDSAYYLRMGQPVLVPKAPIEGWVRLYDADGAFLGVGEVEEDGRIAPRRLMSGG